MINMNILYDYCTCIQVDGKLKSSIIGDSIYVKNALKVLYMK